MEDFKKRNKILVVISVFILLVVALLVSKATYSFLEPLDPDDVIIDSEITATGDTLLFTKGTDINVTLTQDNFNSESGNLVRSVTPQVKLIASNKTNNAEATYYVSLNISENTFKYTNGTSNPEILLTVTDNEGNPLTTCTGLTYTTVGGVSGFDITNKLGVYDFAEQTISTTSSTNGTTKNWTYTVTFINKETDQSINEDATINIEAILHKETETFCELNPDNFGCIFTLSYNPVVSKNITLEDGIIYYHDTTLTNGAEDFSYRYSGANPNNYICFGSDATPCPEANLYRIIGVFPVDTFVRDENSNNYVIKKQNLFKVIRNSYITDVTWDNEKSGTAGTFQWSYNTNSGYNNTWKNSPIYQSLNQDFLLSMTSNWFNKIAKVYWSVGGNTWGKVVATTPLTKVYNNEIVNPTIRETLDNNRRIADKVGLMYVADYGYATIQDYWNTRINNYNNSEISNNNWLLPSVNEWTITRNSELIYATFRLATTGGPANEHVGNNYAVRPTFYLDSSVVIDMTNHAGTDDDPYRITQGGESSYCNIYPNSQICSSNLFPTDNLDEVISENVIDSGKGVIYQHNENMEYSANDGSFRYAGANPNNYVCFGSTATTCPADNIYRIIGLIPVDVVTDDSNPNNIETETQMLYKLIKNDYETETTLGITKAGTASKNSDSACPEGNLPAYNVDSFHWKGAAANSDYNTWSMSTLNTVGLNTNAYGLFSSLWQNKIANVVWNVGGNHLNNINGVRLRKVYENEIINPVTDNTQDGKKTYIAKIGLLYVSDYGYAFNRMFWNDVLMGSSGDLIRNSSNWLYRGVNEWTITRISSNTTEAIRINNTGVIVRRNVNYSDVGVRRVFYLTEDTEIDMANYAGTLTDPYRIVTN